MGGVAHVAQADDVVFQYHAGKCGSAGYNAVNLTFTGTPDFNGCSCHRGTLSGIGEKYFKWQCYSDGTAVISMAHDSTCKSESLWIMDFTPAEYAKLGEGDCANAENIDVEDYGFTMSPTGDNVL